MKNLFDSAANAEIISRLNHLTVQSHPSWGKMNVSQMLFHCTVPLKVAFGEVKLKRSVVGWLFGPLAKRRLVSEKPFDKNLPTDKNFIAKHQPDFTAEKQSLEVLVQKFLNAGVEGISNEPHPFFGKMTPEEWGILSYKHLDHHLRQFGV
jgi:hypothetical protein